MAGQGDRPLHGAYLPATSLVPVATAGCNTALAAECGAAGSAAAAAAVAALQVVPGDRYTALVQPPLQLPSSCFNSMVTAAHWQRAPLSSHIAGDTGPPWLPAPPMRCGPGDSQAHYAHPGPPMPTAAAHTPAGASAAAAAAGGGGGVSRLPNGPSQLQQQQQWVQWQMQQANPSLYRGPGGRPAAPGTARGAPCADPLGGYGPHGASTAAAAAAPCVGAKRQAPDSGFAVSSAKLRPPPLGNEPRCLPPWAAPAWQSASSNAAEGPASQRQHHTQQRIGAQKPLSAAATGAGAWQGDVCVDVAVTRGTHTSERVTTPAAPFPAMYCSSVGAPALPTGAGGQLCASEQDAGGDLLQFLDDLLDVGLEEFGSLCSPADAAW
jgi:hypothetical protein